MVKRSSSLYRTTVQFCLGGGVSLFDSSYGIDIKTDLQGRIYVIGYTSQSNFPTTPNVLPSSLKESINVFISILSPDLTNLLVSYYLGGSNTEYGYRLQLGQMEQSILQELLSLLIFLLQQERTKQL